MNDTIALIWQHGFPEEDRQLLENFSSRDGFQLISDKDLKAMLRFFAQHPEDFENVIPIMTDDDSNYICVYFQGENFGKVCYLRNEETDLQPVLSSITRLIQVIGRHPEAFGFPDLPLET